MMGHWEFNETNPSDVEQEPTQRDQFNNDDVGLADALVREVIQNSMDAQKNGSAVKVRFAIRSLEGENAEKFRALFEGLVPHLRASDIDDTPLKSPQVRLLVIEDFNTKGLTGAIDDLDEDNFRNFWRRHGRSGKGGKTLGRWGLGKLVYSSASQIRVFFGLTRRADEADSLLMAQAVLSNHTLDGIRHPAHGFWFGRRAENTLQIPVVDPAEIAEFSALTGITRTDQTGLSIVVPYLADGISEASVISGVLTNYYFPILSGRLVVEIGSTIISRETFHEIASRAGDDSKDPVPFGYIEEISKRLDEPPMFVAGKPIGIQELNKTFFTEDQLAAMRQHFDKGDIVHVRLPVILRPKDGPDLERPIELFLQMFPEGGRSFALFARGPITLPGERRYFSGSPAYGALVAKDDDDVASVAAFLGDAENPAHTAWNAKAEKLLPNWRSSGPTLASIRHSLRALYGLVADQIETVDRDALIDFFSLVDQSRSAKGKRKRTGIPDIKPEPREKAISIRPRKGGFEIVSGPGAARWEFPKAIRVRVAYDMVGANPFKRHSKFDFDLTKEELVVDTRNVKVDPVGPNVMKLVVSSPEFSLEAKGFDENRDIVVDARAIG